MNKNYFFGIVISAFVSICGMEQAQGPFPLMQLPDELLSHVIHCTPPPLDEAVTTLKTLRLVNKRIRSLLTTKTDLNYIARALQHNCNIYYPEVLQLLSLPVCEQLKKEWYINTSEKIKSILCKDVRYTTKHFNVCLKRTCRQPDGNLLLGVLFSTEGNGNIIHTIYTIMLMRLTRSERIDTNYIVEITQIPRARNVLPSDGFNKLEFITCPSNPNVWALFHEVNLGTEKFKMLAKWEDGKMTPESYFFATDGCDLPAHQIEWDGENVMFK